MSSPFIHISFSCKGNKTLNYKVLKQFGHLDTIGTVVSLTVDEKWPGKNIFVKSISSSDKISHSSNDESGTTVEKDTPCTTLHEFGQRFIMVDIDDGEGQDKSQGQEFERKKTSAFDILMKVSKQYNCLPSERNPVNAKDRLYNRLLDVLKERDIGFTRVQIPTAGQTVVKTITNALWFIDPHVAKLNSRAIDIPSIFKEFTGYNNWKTHKKKEPVCTYSELSQHVAELSDMLMLPWFGLQQFSAFSAECKKFVDGLKKYLTFLEQQQVRTDKQHKSMEPVRSLTDAWSLKTIERSSPENMKYSNVSKTLQEMDMYEYLWLYDFEPEDRYDRRIWYENFSLPFPVKMYTHRVGNYIGNFTFVWRIPESDREDQYDIDVLADIRECLPVLSTRAMRKLFIDRYTRKIGVKSAVLRDMYKFLTSDVSAAESTAQSEVDERFLKFILEADDPDLFYDLRVNNGRPCDERLNPFWDALRKYLEDESVVHERRHGHHCYMPIAISVEDLRAEVLKTLPPDTRAPSVSWLRMNFWPSNPYSKNAANYTGRFEVKYAVQQRLLRASHPDSQYAFYLFMMMKMMAVKFNENSRMICVDDKAIVPIGEPNKPVSTAVRANSRSLVPVNASLAVLDHDFHIHGAVPSVLFDINIPEDPKDSFYHGEIHVTVKDKVFQPSSALRHIVETVKILRSLASMDGVALSQEILFLYSDGGPDHRSTYWSVQLAYILLFIALDLDLLVTARTAPSHSYRNPAERCMSVLNLALQNVALERKPMSEDQEFRVKSLSTMKKRRDLAKKEAHIKEAMVASVEPVISSLTQRFGRLKYQEGDVKIHDAASDDDISFISSALDLFRDPDEDTPLTLEDVADKKRLRNFPRLDHFIEDHCRARHYSFQVKKCGLDRCFYCVINPPRVSEDTFKNLKWLPDPVLEEGGNEYKKFEDVYGTETDDKDRPSLREQCLPTERDKKLKGIHTAASARATIMCAECGKQRVVYSKKKLSREEMRALDVIQEQLVYTCGSQLFSGQYADTIVVKEGQNCHSPIHKLHTIPQSQYNLRKYVFFVEVMTSIRVQKFRTYKKSTRLFVQSVLLAKPMERSLPGEMGLKLGVKEITELELCSIVLLMKE